MIDFALVCQKSGMLRLIVSLYATCIYRDVRGKINTDVPDKIRVHKVYRIPVPCAKTLAMTTLAMRTAFCALFESLIKYHVTRIIKDALYRERLRMYVSPYRVHPRKCEPYSPNVPLHQLPVTETIE